MLGERSEYISSPKGRTWIVLACVLSALLVLAIGRIYVLGVNVQRLAAAYGKLAPYMTQRVAQESQCVQAAQKIYQPLILVTAEDPYADNQVNVNALNAAIDGCKARYPLPS